MRCLESRPPSAVCRAVVPLEDMRARTEALRRRSQALRERSVAAFARRDVALQTLEIRRELLRSEFQELRVRLHAARAVSSRDADLQDWMAGEVLEMIVAGWSRAELGAVGIGPALLRELRLDGHPALHPSPDDSPA